MLIAVMVIANFWVIEIGHLGKKPLLRREPVLLLAPVQVSNASVEHCQSVLCTAQRRQGAAMYKCRGDHNDCSTLRDRPILSAGGRRTDD